MAKYFVIAHLLQFRYTVCWMPESLKNMLQLASFQGSLIRECFSYSKNWVEAWEQGYGKI